MLEVDKADFARQVDKWLKKNEEKVIDLAVDVLSDLALDTEFHLKEGLSTPGGKGPDGKIIRSQPGQLPFAQSGDLRRSIGSIVKRMGSRAEAFVGSGINAEPVEYAKYLEGNDEEPGIRPFLYWVKYLFSLETFKERFKERFKSTFLKG